MHPLLDNRVRSRLRIRHLELLDVLGDTLNIHKAAPRLNLSQPATSKLLHETESLYNTSLFERLARGLKPTAAGEAAIRSARSLLNEIGESLSEAHLVASGVSGRVRIGALPAAIPTLYQRALTKAHAAMPKLVICVTETSLDGLLASLKRRELDLVLARLSGETQQSSFETEALYEESVCLVVRPTHPCAKRRRLKIEDLAHQEWILPPENAPVRQEVIRNFSDAGLPCPQAWMETNSLLLTETAIMQRDVIAALPKSVAVQYQARGQLRILRASFNIHMPPLGVVKLAGVQLAPNAAQLLNVIKSELRWVA